jgi:hypothetical protein
VSKPPRAAHGGRAYTTEATFRMRWGERIRALLGGSVHLRVQIVVIPGASSNPTEITKRVEWPWKR